MDFELVICLMSVFQIYHQSLSNSLINFGYTTTQLSLISSLFPMGKFFGTFIMVYLFNMSFSNKKCLDYSALFLILGGVLMLIPFFLILCISRIVIGIGVGIAFISGFVALHDTANNRDAESIARRHRAFISAGILFSMGVFFANGVAFSSRIFSHYFQLVVFAVPPFCAGALYFVHRSDYLEPLNLSSKLEWQKRVKDYICQKCLAAKAQEKSEKIFSSNHFELPMSMTTEKHLYVKNAKAMAILLMCLNASIGVPVILAFSLPIYEALGMPHEGAMKLSVAYPLAQLILVWLWRLRNTNSNPSNQALILWGYAFCLLVTFLLLLTLSMPTLQQEARSRTVASCFWLTILAISSAVPCNAGVSLITRNLFRAKKLP